eukprot:510957-Heterocapsa_arctica.AAC.1
MGALRCLTANQRAFHSACAAMGARLAVAATNSSTVSDGWASSDQGSRPTPVAQSSHRCHAAIAALRVLGSKWLRRFTHSRRRTCRRRLSGPLWPWASPAW